MRNVIAVCCLTILIALPGCGAPTVALPKPPGDDVIRPVVAVSTFENRSGFPGKWELGTGMADVLVAELVASKHFVVVERRDLGLLIGEIDAQGTEYFRPQGQVERGQLKNVKYFLRGVITDFTQTARANLAAGGNSWGLGGKGHVARVALTIAVIDVETGQIVDAVNVAADARAGGVYGSGEYKNVRFGGEAFFRTPLGIATRNAMRKALRQLVETVPKDQWLPRIAEVDGDRLVITGGKKQKQTVGMTFAVLGPDRIITDPDTGDPVATIAGQTLGHVRIVQVLDRAAIAEPVDGNNFQRGLRLRPVSE